LGRFSVFRLFQKPKAAVMYSKRKIHLKPQTLGPNKNNAIKWGSSRRGKLTKHFSSHPCIGQAILACFPFKNHRPTGSKSITSSNHTTGRYSRFKNNKDTQKRKRSCQYVCALKITNIKKGE